MDLMAGTAVGGRPGGGMVTVGIGLAVALGAVTPGRGHFRDTIGDRMLSLSPRGVFAVFAGAATAVIIDT